MSRPNLIAFIFFVVLLAGCADSPRTADLLIQNARDEVLLSTKDAFVVNLPIGRVSNMLNKMADECIHQKVTRNFRDASGEVAVNITQTIELIPKVIVDKERTRLTVQYKVIEGIPEMGNIPPNGLYFMLVDAYPVDKYTTRVESYYQQTSFHALFQAVIPWVTGRNMTCPNLTF